MPTAVAITSIIANKNISTEYDISVIMTGCSEESIQKISSLESDGVKINIIQSENPHENLGLDHREHVPRASLLKFNIAEFIPHYDKVLYIDGDTIVMGDLSEFYNMNIDDKYAAVVKDMKVAMLYEQDDIFDNNNYFNAGVQLLNTKKIRNDGIVEKLIETKRNWESDRFMEQDVFNYVYNKNVLFVSCRYNFLSTYTKVFNTHEILSFYKEDSFSILILHLTYKKPWKHDNIPFQDIWHKYYDISPYKDIPLNTTNEYSALKDMGLTRRVKRLAKIEVKRILKRLGLFELVKRVLSRRV